MYDFATIIERRDLFVGVLFCCMFYEYTVVSLKNRLIFLGKSKTSSIGTPLACIVLYSTARRVLWRN